MGIRSWSFQDNGAAGANGGLYGPFEFDANGVMFVGATVPGAGGNSLENVQVRVHPGYKPIAQTKDAVGFPSLSADGVPLTSGQWFTLQDVNSNWYFSVPNQTSGEQITYWFLILEGCGFNGNGFRLDPSDLAAGGSLGGGTFFEQLATAAAILAATGPHDLRGWYIFNEDTVENFIQLFDAPNAGAVTVGTTVPKLSFGIPPGAAANILASEGIPFTEGIVIAATTTPTGNTAPANPLDVNLFF